MNFYELTFASTYNCNAYGVGDYSNQDCVTETTEPSASPATPGLAETGMPVIASVLGGVLLLVIGAVLVFKALRHKKSSLKK